MIVAMKKVTVLALNDDRESTVASLRDLGVLHLIRLDHAAGDDVERARQDRDRARSALAVLQSYDQRATAASAPPAVSTAELIRDVHAASLRQKEIEEQIEDLREEKLEIEPLGDFDPVLAKQLEASGVCVKLFYAATRQRIEPPEGTVVVVLRQDAGGRYLAAVGQSGCRLPGREIPLPARRLSDVIEEIRGLEEERGRIDAHLASLAGGAEAVSSMAREYADRVGFLEVKKGMSRDRQIAYLQGFCPVDLVGRLREEAGKSGWGLVVEDPSPQDAPPTLIRNPAWLRPIHSLFALINIYPGYREVDVSASFLFFLSLFFAMIIGDAGYGLVFLLLTIFFRIRMPKAAPEPFRLLTIFSVCTILWGIVSGAYFGIASVPAPLARLRIDWLSDNRNVMHLCLFLGAIHLSVAHVWNMLRMLNSAQAFAQAGWTGITWTLFFSARTLLLEKPFPAWCAPVAIVSMLAVVLFMTPVQRLKTEWINHAMLPLTLMSSFGDVLSYLRLFALSVAGLQLAGAFNSMAASLGFSRPLQGLVAALIVFLGHGLNIALGAISVLVHGLRLNALEFSMHFGLEWTGYPYRPFARQEASSAGNRTT